MPPGTNQNLGGILSMRKRRDYKYSKLIQQYKLMKEKKKWWLYKDKKENKFIKFMDKHELWVALEILVTMFILGGTVLVLLLMIGLYG